MKCPKCQYENREGANFCIKCGENSRLNALIVVTLYLLRHYFVMNVGIR